MTTVYSYGMRGYGLYLLGFPRRLVIRVENKELRWKLYGTNLSVELMDCDMAKIIFMGEFYYFPYMSYDVAEEENFIKA